MEICDGCNRVIHLCVCLVSRDPQPAQPTQEHSGEWSKEPWSVWHRASDIIGDLIRAVQSTCARMERMAVTGETSDGYHTFNELYEYRKLYNAALFNEWAAAKKFNVHKSLKHDDGELCFGGGWFIVKATLPTGQISNHYKEADWNLFRCEERDVADKWDGHTPKVVAKRLSAFLADNLLKELEGR